MYIYIYIYIYMYKLNFFFDKHLTLNCTVLYINYIKAEGTPDPKLYCIVHELY